LSGVGVFSASGPETAVQRDPTGAERRRPRRCSPLKLGQDPPALTLRQAEARIDDAEGKT